MGLAPWARTAGGRKWRSPPISGTDAGIALALLLSCADEPETPWPIKGKVLRVNERSLLLEHEEIEGLMPAMVMEIAAHPDELQDLSAGDYVEGQLLVTTQTSRLADLEVVSHDDAPEEAPEEPTVSALVVGDHLEATELPSSTGETLLVGRGQGTPTVLTYLFTSCPLPEYCPLLASKLASLQTEIKGKARIVAVTLDPETDTPEVLQAYGKGFASDPEVWHFARLELPELEALLERCGVSRVPNEGTLMHSLRLLVLDSDGRVVHMERDNSWDVDIIAAKVLSTAQ